MGLDTECDQSFEANGRTGTGNRAEITRLRDRLLAHWLGCDDAILEAAVRNAGGVGAGLEVLRSAGYARLRPIELPQVRGIAAVISAFHLGDGTRTL